MVETPRPGGCGCRRMRVNESRRHEIKISAEVPPREGRLTSNHTFAYETPVSFFSWQLKIRRIVLLAIAQEQVSRLGNVLNAVARRVRSRTQTRGYLTPRSRVAKWKDENLAAPAVENVESYLCVRDLHLPAMEFTP